MTLGFPAAKDMSAQWYAFMGIDRDAAPEYNNPSAFAKAPADEAWVYSCVRRLYQSAQGVPLRVYVRAGRDLIPADAEPSPEGDDLQNLLDYANPVDMTGGDLKAYTVASYAVWGESFLRKVRGRLGGPPQELYWLRAMDIDIDTRDGVKTITYHPPQADPQYLKPRDVVHFKTPNLANPSRGLSPLSAVGSAIATGKGWADRQNSDVHNDSIPKGYWQIPKDAEFAQQDESRVRRVLGRLRGPKARGKTPIMPAGLEFKGISLTPQDAEMVHTQKLSRMAVCAALGVPLVLAGDDEKSTVYANLRDAERIFWRGTMIPLLDGYADVLNNWLVPEFDATRKRLIVAFDYSDIEALRPTLDIEMNTWLGAIYAQAVVPNEFRRKFRIGSDVPWGNKPVPRTQIAMRPAPEAIPIGAIPTMSPEDQATLPESSEVVSNNDDGLYDAAATLRSLGKGLYRHPAVVKFVAGESLDVGELLGYRVSPAVRSHLETGLSRRYSAVQIVGGVSAEGYRPMAGPPPDPVLALAEGVKALAEKQQPITVNVSTPDVHVTTPDVVVNNAAPIVNVDVPKQAPPTVTVNVPAQKSVTKAIKRDTSGAIVAITETPED